MFTTTNTRFLATMACDWARTRLDEAGFIRTGLGAGWAIHPDQKPYILFCVRLGVQGKLFRRRNVTRQVVRDFVYFTLDAHDFEIEVKTSSDGRYDEAVVTIELPELKSF